MRTLALAALAVATTALSPPSLAGPPGAVGAVYVTSGSAHWGGGAYRPVSRPVYGPGFGYGYGGWRYGYPGYGYGYGFGLGYGPGFAFGAASPWFWGTPSVSYVAPAFYPYGVVTPLYAGVGVAETLTYIQPAQVEPVAPGPARKAAGLWYYCTEPAGYHPYVAQCTRPWIAVEPQSPSQPADGVR